MNCFYYIKLPNGGEIEISANYSLISETDSDLQNLFNTYYDSISEESVDIKETQKAKKDILTYLNNLGVGLSNSSIDYQLKKSDASTITNNLNLIIDKGDVNELFYQLRGKVWSKNLTFNYINTNKKPEQISLEEFKNKISAPVKIDYLSDLSSIGLLGVTSINSALKELKNKVNIYSGYTDFNSVEKSVLTFLNKVLRTDAQKMAKLYSLDFTTPVNDSIVIYEKDSESPIYIYNENSIFSLYLSVLKDLGINSNPIELKELLKIYDSKTIQIPNNEEEVKEFFIGKFSDAGKYTIGGFDELLKSKTGIIFIKNNLLPLIVKSAALKNEWSEKDSLIILGRAVKILGVINSAKYTKTAVDEIESSKRKYSLDQLGMDETVSEFNRKSVEKYIIYENQNYHYGITNKETFSNTDDIILSAYNHLKSNTIIGKDLVKVKLDGGNFVFMVPKKMAASKGKIIIDGFFWSKEHNRVIDRIGTIEPTDTKENKKITVEYRTLQDTTDPVKDTDIPIATKLTAKESITVHPRTDGTLLSPKFVRKVAVRGSEISTNRGKSVTVKYVYPSGMAVNQRAGILLYSSVKSISIPNSAFEDNEFTDAQIEEKVSLLKQYVEVPGGKNGYVEEDDIISYSYKGVKRYNRVMYVEGNEVYILYKTEGGKHLITPIKLESIYSIYKKENDIALDERITIENFIDKVHSGNSLQDSRYSYFTDFELSKNGDFVIHDNEIYQIIDKDQKIFSKVIVSKSTYKLTKTYEKIEDTNNLNLFATERNISGNFANQISEMNSMRLYTEKKGDDFVKAVYLIPKKLLGFVGTPSGSGNLNIGRPGEYSYYYNPDGTKTSKFKDDLVDITDILIQKISQKNNTNPEGLFIQKIVSYDASKRGFLVKYNENLRKFNFDEIDNKDKKKFFQVGAFVVFTNIGNDGRTYTEGRTYRVNNMTKNTLELEYSKFSKEGKVISVVKTVSIEDAIKKIKYLYIQKGNDKLQQLIDLSDKELYAQKKSKEADVISEIAVKFQEAFNIPMIIEKVSPKDMEKKKAWITAEKEPKIVINLGNKKANKSDLVHEYLHLFLFALKYKSISEGKDTYEKLLTDFKEKSELETDDFGKLEEEFVKSLTDFMSGLTDSPNVSEELFVTSFKESLEKIGITDIIYPSDIFSILNMDLKDIFTTITDSKMKDSGLIMFEANFRNWLTDNLGKDIKINCI